MAKHIFLQKISLFTLL